MHRLKFSGWRDVAPAFASAIEAAGLVPEVDAATWVPLARARLAERGYDQARVLAEALGRRTGIPTRQFLRRTVASGPQARRSGPDRREALRGAFQVVRPPPARILLVDDVLTTGATAAACAEALTAAGATHVHLVAAARSFAGAVSGARTGPPGAGRAERPGSGEVARAYTRAGSRPGLWLPGDHPR